MMRPFPMPIFGSKISLTAAGLITILSTLRATSVTMGMSTRLAHRTTSASPLAPQRMPLRWQPSLEVKAVALSPGLCHCSRVTIAPRPGHQRPDAQGESESPLFDPVWSASLFTPKSPMTTARRLRSSTALMTRTFSQRYLGPRGPLSRSTAYQRVLPATIKLLDRRQGSMDG